MCDQRQGRFQSTNSERTLTHKLIIKCMTRSTTHALGKSYELYFLLKRDESKQRKFHLGDHTPCQSRRCLKLSQRSPFNLSL